MYPCLFLQGHLVYINLRVFTLCLPVGMCACWGAGMCLCPYVAIRLQLLWVRYNAIGFSKFMLPHEQPPRLSYKIRRHQYWNFSHRRLIQMTSWSSIWICVQQRLDVDVLNISSQNNETIIISKCVHIFVTIVWAVVLIIATGFKENNDVIIHASFVMVRIKDLYRYDSSVTRLTLRLHRTP